ncbi:MAG: insulinase family protein [bacterium]|nr:insulinase family protein [bacterium]MCP4799934.1 insulinase family protein [bacterium]
MNLELYRDESPPHREVLDSGTVLVTVPLPSAHSIALGVWLRHGTQDEPAGLGGMAHFLEHMVFKGSENHDAYGIARTFDSLGASVDAFTTKDHIAFTLKVLPEYFTDACKTLADMLLRPSFESAMIELEQNVVCEEILEARDTPEDLLHDAFASQVYKEHPRSRPILGSAETVRSLDSDTLFHHHNIMFSGPNIVISISGCITSELIQVVRDQFGLQGNGFQSVAAEKTDAPFTAADEVTADATIVGNRLEIVSQIQQCYFEIGNKAVSFMHSDRVPLIMLSSILGGGMSSRLFQAIREREGLAYTIYNYSDMGRDIGLTSCAGSCSPKRLLRVEEIIRHEYASVLNDSVLKQELADNKAQIKSQLVFSLEGISNQMLRAAKDEIYYGRFQSISELVEMVDAVTEDDIVRCARKYFNPDDLLVATHGPSS